MGHRHKVEDFRQGARFGGDSREHSRAFKQVSENKHQIGGQQEQESSSGEEWWHLHARIDERANDYRGNGQENRDGEG